jgi:tetratricopeptide (TPR) repeat protein
MQKRTARVAARFAFLLALTSLLSACVARGPFIPASMAPGARTRVELDATPFFPQKKYQCGPAALASVLVASDVVTTPDALVPLVFIPARKGSLQVEMQAAPRKFERLSYLLSPNMDSILAEINAGRPVLVLHNYGLPGFPRWHYAVVIGYDSARDRFILRSGVKRRDEWRARTFMVAWHQAHRWAMVILRPGEIPVIADPKLYLESAADFEHGATPEDALLAFDAAVKRWPSEAVAWIGRGTAQYRAGKLAEASQDYAAALRVDGSNAGARNNFAQTLLERGCPRHAREQLMSIDFAKLRSPLREAVIDTRQQVEAAVAKTPYDNPACAIPVSNS